MTTGAAAADEVGALRLSLATGLAFAGTGITVGVVAGSQLILFDGVFALLGVGLSWMALKASRLARSGPTATFPFGKEGLAPLVVGFEGVALLATCAYAGVDAVLTLLDGGSQVAGGLAIAYAGASLVVPLVVAARLGRVRHSELVAAEAVQWRAGAGLGAGMLVAFVAAALLDGSSWSAVAPYIDPALVLVAAVVFAVPPVRMMRTTLVELLEGAPPTDVQAPVHAAVAAARHRFGLDEPFLRMSKLGSKLYVELDFVVDPSWTVGASDEVREVLLDRLDGLHLDLWMTVEFSADPTWGA